MADDIIYGYRPDTFLTLSDFAEPLAKQRDTLLASDPFYQGAQTVSTLDWRSPTGDWKETLANALVGGLTQGTMKGIGEYRTQSALSDIEDVISQNLNEPETLRTSLVELGRDAAPLVSAYDKIGLVRKAKEKEREQKRADQLFQMGMIEDPESGQIVPMEDFQAARSANLIAEVTAKREAELPFEQEKIRIQTQLAKLKEGLKPKSLGDKKVAQTMGRIMLELERARSDKDLDLDTNPVIQKALAEMNRYNDSLPEEERANPEALDSLRRSYEIGRKDLEQKRKISERDVISGFVVAPGKALTKEEKADIVEATGDLARLETNLKKQRQILKEGGGKIPLGGTIGKFFNALQADEKNQFRNLTNSGANFTETEMALIDAMSVTGFWKNPTGYLKDKGLGVNFIEFSNMMSSILKKQKDVQALEAFGVIPLDADLSSYSKKHFTIYKDEFKNWKKVRGGYKPQTAESLLGGEFVESFKPLGSEQPVKSLKTQTARPKRDDFKNPAAYLNALNTYNSSLRGGQ